MHFLPRRNIGKGDLVLKTQWNSRRIRFLHFVCCDVYSVMLRVKGRHSWWSWWCGCYNNRQTEKSVMTRNKQACCFQLLWQHTNMTHIMIIIDNTIFNESLTLRMHSWNWCDAVSLCWSCWNSRTSDWTVVTQSEWEEQPLAGYKKLLQSVTKSPTDVGLIIVFAKNNRMFHSQIFVN